MFDIRFLRELYRKAEEEFSLNLEVIDTRELWIRLRNRGRVPSHLKGSLRVVAEYFEIDYENAHDALIDCQITAQVFYKILEIMAQINS
jgi:DNA polymerase III alpha subunit (gram-positive type)